MWRCTWGRSAEVIRNGWLSNLSMCDTFHAPHPSRDGGTGRRSGLKIRRPLRSWGFDPPSRHQQNKELRLNLPLEIGEAKIVWWLFWWLLVATMASADNGQRRRGSVEAQRTDRSVVENREKPDRPWGEVPIVWPALFSPVWHPHSNCIARLSAGILGVCANF